MSAFDEFLQRNRSFAGSAGSQQPELMPRARLFVVTCVDSRVEPAGFLGVGPGEAFVLRNPGGRVTATAIADIALISFIGEAIGVGEGAPLEVAIIHHTQCGMGFLADEGFRHEFSGRTGIDEGYLATQAVTDPVATVRADVERLLSSPLTTARIIVSGHVFNLGTGLVSTVVAATAPHTAPHAAREVA
jgi:carbonic anhydrase